MTGELDMNDNVITNVGYPLALTDAAHKGYVNELMQNLGANLRDDIADYVPLDGATMTGRLTLSGAPTTANQAATKAYVDTQVSEISTDALVAKAGSTMTGNLVMNNAKLSFGQSLSGMPTLASASHIVPSVVLYNNFPSTTQHTVGMGYGTDTVDSSEWLWQTTNRGPGSTNGGYRWYGRGSKLMELHAANGLIVTGTVTAANVVNQTALDYVNVAFSADFSINASTANAAIAFNKINASGGAITYNTTTGAFLLRAGKTYHLRAALGGQGNINYIYYAWKNAANTIIGGGSVGGAMGLSQPRSDMANPIAEAIYSVNVDETVFLKTQAGGAGTMIIKPSGATSFSSSWATIIQLR
jgi:hypothetical protein